MQLLEESLDRAEENVSRLTAHVDKTESDRDDAERRLGSLENAEATVSEKYDDQVTNPIPIKWIIFSFYLSTVIFILFFYIILRDILFQMPCEK